MRTMIRLISVVTIIGIALVSVITAEEFDSEKFDNVDVHALLDNERLRGQYYACFMGQAPCTTTAMRYYKSMINDALVTKCGKCNEKQKSNLDIVSDWYTKNKPDDWNALIKKSVEDAVKNNNG